MNLEPKHSWLELVLSFAVAVWSVLLLLPLPMSADTTEARAANTAHTAPVGVQALPMPPPQVDPGAPPEALPPTF